MDTVQPNGEFQDPLRSMAKAAGLEFIEKIPDPDVTALECIPAALAQQHCIIPLGWTQIDNERLIRIAIPDPTDLGLIDELENQLKVPLDPVVARPINIARAITRYYEND